MAIHLYLLNQCDEESLHCQDAVQSIKHRQSSEPFLICMSFVSHNRQKPEQCHPPQFTDELMEAQVREEICLLSIPSSAQLGDESEISVRGRNTERPQVLSREND